MISKILIKDSSRECNNEQTPTNYPSLYHVDQVTSYLLESEKVSSLTDSLSSLEISDDNGASSDQDKETIQAQKAAKLLSKKKLFLQACMYGCSTEVLAYLIHNSDDKAFHDWIQTYRDDETGETCLHYVCRKTYASNLSSSTATLLEKVKIILGTHLDLMFVPNSREGKLPLEYVRPYMAKGWRWRSWLTSTEFSTGTHYQTNESNYTSSTIPTNIEDSMTLAPLDCISVFSDSFSSVSEFTTSASDYTDDEMVTHVTSILATHLEVIMIDRSGKNKQNQSFDSSNNAKDDDTDLGENFDNVLQADLKLLVKMIASMYHNVPYHSFDHAHHVVSGTNDLLDMLVPVEDEGDEEHPCSHYLYSNVNLRFAAVFASLIHDVDHTGIANPQLVLEEHPLALLYGGDSIAEKNSIVVGFMILMRPEFKRLRLHMFQTEQDFSEFQEIVTNLVMTTDIGNAQATKVIVDAWEEAFGAYDITMQQEQEGKGSIMSFSNHLPSTKIDENDRKRAFAVLYYIMRSSDVIHLMEDWDTFVKWCKLCYIEFRAAYLVGKGEDTGAQSWHEGQIMFLDKYITPLAQRLNSSGAFGEFGIDMIENIAYSRGRWLEEGFYITRGLNGIFEIG